MKHLGIFFVVISFCTGSLFAEAISVTDVKGRKMEVEVLAYTQSTGKTKVKRMADNSVFTVQMDVFDEASQKLIIANAPKEKAELIIKVSVGKRRKRQGDSSYMKDQTVSASFKVINDSRDIDFPKGKSTLFLVGREMKRYSDNNADYGKVLSKQTFPVEVSAGAEVEIEAKPMVTSYDSDRDSSNIGGFEYYGYILILQDEEGDIHSVETSIGNLKKDLEEYPELAKGMLPVKTGALVERNFEKR